MPNNWWEPITPPYGTDENGNRVTQSTLTGEPRPPSQFDMWMKSAFTNLPQNNQFMSGRFPNWQYPNTYYQNQTQPQQPQQSYRPPQNINWSNTNPIQTPKITQQAKPSGPLGTNPIPTPKLVGKQSGNFGTNPTPFNPVTEVGYADPNRGRSANRVGYADPNRGRSSGQMTQAGKDNRNLASRSAVTNPYDLRLQPYYRGRGAQQSTYANPLLIQAQKSIPAYYAYNAFWAARTP